VTAGADLNVAAAVEAVVAAATVGWGETEDK